MGGKKKKSLDDFFAKQRRHSSKGANDICDLSLCSATTRKEVRPTALCTWKKNPNAFKLEPNRVGHHQLGGLSKLSSMRQNMFLMQVKEQSRVSEIATSSMGGVTLGIGQLLYKQKADEQRQDITEKRTDETSKFRDSDADTLISSSITVNGDSDEQSIEVSMSGFEFSIESKNSSVSSLGRRGARMMKEARLAEQKVWKEENKIAEKRRLLTEEHSEFQNLIREFRKEAQRAEERRQQEEARLAERRRLLKEAYLKEQDRLVQEGQRLMEEREKAAETTKRIFEEARIADLDTVDEQISRSLSNVYTLGVLSETTWEHDDESSQDILEEEQPLGKEHWTEIDASMFEVRGKNYLIDRKKVPSKPNLFRLITVDMVEVSRPIMTGFCSHPKERVQRWLHQEKNDHGTKMPEFIFCVNMVLPGPPFYHLVMYFAIDDLSALGLTSGSKKHPYTSSIRKFLFGKSDEFRNKCLKFIPRVKEGSFLLKTAVGTKPFILGKYLDQKFIKGERYLEVIADVGSSTTFQKLVRLSSNYNSEIVGAMAFVLEASDEASLPENVLCSVELNNNDFDGKIRFLEDQEI